MITCGVHIDKLSLIIALCLFIISFLVQAFSIFYMKNEVKNYRFFAYLNLFNFTMAGLLFSPNLFQMYFFWELDDAAGATINLKFVSSDADFETGYMLDDVSSTTGLDFNYNVTVYSKYTTSVVGTPISVTAATVLQTKTLAERTIQVFSSGGSNNSYVTISMEVIAPIWEDGGTAAFMDAQYAGYIVAELKFT